MNFDIKKIGKTVLGQSIDCWYNNSNNAFLRVLIVGGVHGDEAEGIQIANSLINSFMKYEGLQLNLAIIPCLNRDGETLGLRSNYNDVDLNRNVPTKNWISSFTNPRYKPGPSAGSEPETEAFMEVVNDFKPNLIISLHSFSESLLLYGPADGKFNSNIEELSKELNLKIVDKMPYEVVGSLNSLSKELQIPTITVEAPRDNTWPEKKDLFVKGLFNFFLRLQ